MTGYSAPNGSTLLEATGAGSTLSLPNLGGVSVGTTLWQPCPGPGTRRWFREPAFPGKVNTGPVQFETDGPNSVLNISALASFTGVNDGTAPSLQISNGGTLQADALSRMNDGYLTQIGGTVSLPKLTNLDASDIEVSGGGTLTLAGVTGYRASNGSTFLEATGAGSVLSLPQLGNVTVGTGAYGYRVQVQALAGGFVRLPSLTQINTGPVQFETDGGNSVLYLSALTSFAGPNDGTAPSLQVSNGGISRRTR